MTGKRLRRDGEERVRNGARPTPYNRPTDPDPRTSRRAAGRFVKKSARSVGSHCRSRGLALLLNPSGERARASDRHGTQIEEEDFVSRPLIPCQGGGGYYTRNVKQLRDRGRTDRAGTEL